MKNISGIVGAFEKIEVDNAALDAAMGSVLDKAYGKKPDAKAVVGTVAEAGVEASTGAGVGTGAGYRRAVAIAAAVAVGLMLTLTVAAKMATGSFIGFFMNADPATEHYIDGIISRDKAQTAVSGNYALTLESYANDSGSLYMFFELSTVDGSRILPSIDTEYPKLAFNGVSGLFRGGSSVISESFRILDSNNYDPDASSVYVTAILSGGGGEPVVGEHSITVSWRNVAGEIAGVNIDVNSAENIEGIDGKWVFDVVLTDNYPTRQLTADVEGTRYDLLLTPMTLLYGYDDKNWKIFDDYVFGEDCVEALDVDGAMIWIPIDSFGYPNQFYTEVSGASRFKLIIEPEDVAAVYVNGKRYAVSDVEYGAPSVFDAINEHYDKVAMGSYNSIKDVCVKAESGKYGDIGWGVLPDVWEVPESTLVDGAARYLSDGNGDIIAMPPQTFKAGDSANIHIDLDLSNRWSDSESEYNLVGYYLDGEFTELFSGKVPGGGYDIPATMPADGDYVIVVMNTSAGGQFYREISIR